MTATNYDVNVRYAMSGQPAVGNANAIAGAMGRADRAAVGLRSTLISFGGIAAVGFGIRAAKSSFIDFNSNVEQATIGLSAQAMLLKGGTWDQSMRHATALFSHYQQVAKASVGETEDFLDFHQRIAAKAMSSGVSDTGIEAMTKGGVIASAVLRKDAAQTSLDIKQMLAGRVELRDEVAQILLASQGKTAAQFNAMNQKQRNALVLKSLTDPGLMAAAKAMENSFAGVTSTLKDNLNIALGKIGLPLFKALTAEVQRWNQWIEKHPQEIAAFARTFSRALVDGFQMVKSVVGFIVEHQNLLMTLAKMWLISKGVGFAAGLGSMGGGGLGKFAAELTNATRTSTSFAGALSSAVGGPSSGLGSFVTALGTAVTALALIHTAAQGLADTFLAQADEDRRRKEEITRFRDIQASFRAARFGVGGDLNAQDARQFERMFANKLKDAGVIGQGGALNEQMAKALFERELGGRELREQLESPEMKALIEQGGNAYSQQLQAQYAPIAKEVENLLATSRFILGAFAADPKRLETLLGTKKDEPDVTTGKKTKPGDVVQHIHKVEVAAPDPDRFMEHMRLVGSRLARSPTRARDALPRGR